jgi:NADH dehydrogenase FAD-containing subunit
MGKGTITLILGGGVGGLVTAVELRKRGVEVIQGEIEGIDPGARRVTVPGQDHEADQLVISLGA